MALCFRSPRRGRPRARSCARLAALTALCLGLAPAGAQALSLPDAGVPLPVLLREAPGLVPATGTAVTALPAASPRASAAGRRSWVPGSIVQVRQNQEAVVHARPNGPVVEVFDDTSDQGGQPRAFTVYRVAPGGWLGVSVAALRGRLGWIKADPSRLLARPAMYEIRVSLRRRTLTLLRRGRAVMHTLVVIGAAGTPTPPGHFAIDDKIRFSHPDPAYGPGVLALSVPPPHLNWRQWRVAIHGTNNLGTLGGTGSLGCVHVPSHDLYALLAGVPVGTPVDIIA